jgi:ligand-binding SRPBCC domain-containing protein
MSFVLERRQIVQSPRHEVFAFFADAGNLERMTPPSLRFAILTPTPIVMAPGATIDYRIKLAGLPFRWRTVIEAFEPDVRFVDIQASGPYRSWRHVHEFTDVPGGTAIRDRVDYALPFGALGVLARALFVRAQLDRIFDHRRAVITQLFGAPPSPVRP